MPHAAPSQCCHRSGSRIRFALLACLSALAVPLAPPAANAQIFTRIVDPANPVTHDFLETGGGSWFDIDGDGDLDLFVAHGNLTSQNNALYRNLGGFGFERVVTGSVVLDGGSSIGGTFGDFDRDGFVDLFVTNRNNFGNFLYRGLGDTSFVAVAGAAPVTDIANSNSASWVDVDGDGNLDLYVLNFQGDDFFYRNAGAPTYALQRVVVPGWTTGIEFSIHSAWADFDDDGDMDQFVANAGNQNDALFVNGGGFNMVRRVIADGRTTLGGSWGDFDNDGDLDLFSASYLTQASTLYRNGGPPSYNLVAVSGSVFPSTIGDAVGSAWGDVDNDGDLDLVVSFDNGQNETLYLNTGPPTYAFARVTTGDLATSGGDSFGCSLADIDGDGDLDWFVANHNNQADALYRNDSPAGTWLAIRLHGVVSNPQGIGARVRVRYTGPAGARWLTQQVLPISGYNSQNLELHFGLAGAVAADSINVRWPSGIRQVSVGVPANQRLELVEDVSTAAEASLVFARATPAGVEIEWEVAAASGTPVRVERRPAGGAWTRLGERTVDGTRRVRWSDGDVTPGAALGYRLAFDEGGRVTFAGETSVRVPLAEALSLSMRGGTGGEPLRARVELPEAGPITLDLVDAAGRRAADPIRLALASGSHEIPLTAGRALEPGLYWARLRQGAGIRVARALVLR